MGTLWNLQSQFLVAIQNDDLPRVHRLLEQGLDPDLRFLVGSQKRPAVCLCAERDNVQLLKLLMQWGCSINQSDSSGLTALHIAANHSSEKMVGLLLKCRSHVNAVTVQGHTPLHMASQRHSVEVVQLLVEAGAEVNRSDDEGKTALLNACIHGHAEVADYLIGSGADVTVSSPCGNTPLLFAASTPHLDVGFLAMLLRAKAPVNRQNRQGESALHAVMRGQRPNRRRGIDLLLRYGCDLDARTSLGHTPLHLAALERDDSAVLQLVRAGCDVDCPDELGLTPLFYLVRDGNRPMAELLMAAGSRLANQSWLGDVNLLASVKDPALVDWLLTTGQCCPRLLELCRRTLRTSWGKSADDAVRRLTIPASLKRYLSFEIS